MARPLRREESDNPFFSQSKITVEEMAQQQGVKPITNPDDLLGDFWPEDESIDDFIATVREWRNEGVLTDWFD